MDFHLEPNRPASTLPPIDFEAELNAEQYAAVTAEPGPALVLAGAGSGKTRTLTYRVAYLLQQGFRPHEILLLTFTNKAAKEMLHRVEDLTGIPARQFWGGTFHHIGQKILRSHGELVGLQKSYTILDAGDAESLMSDVVKDLDPSFLKDKVNPRAGVLSDIYSMARNTRLTPAQAIIRFYPHLDDTIDRATRFFAAYQKKKQEQQVADYDDLLEYLLLLLQQHENIREYYQNRFRYVLVDEYQDTNPLQAQIVDLMAGGRHQVMAVGDDAQCIYSWRGADVSNILTFPDRHPGTAIYKIETNYRSTPEILNLANGVLIHQAPQAGFQKELRAARGSNVRPYFVPAIDARQQAEFIVQRLTGLVDEGYALSDVAVLYRAHYQALDLQMELSRRQVPFQITSGIRFFEQAHIRDLVAQLRFAYNPKDVTSFQRVSALLPKIGPKTALKLHALASEIAAKQKISIIESLLDASVQKKVPGDAKEEWPKLIWSLRDMAEAMNTRTPADAVQIGLDSWYGDYVRGAYNNYNSRVDDLKGLVSFAGRYEDMQELLAQLVLLNSETTDRSVDPEEERLRLTTVHQAKGLEFPVVFLIGLGDGLFPLRRAIEQNDVEEERRLFYVAVTRAKDELYLCYPRMSAGHGPPMGYKPSRFLQELPEHLYEHLRLQTRRW